MLWSIKYYFVVEEWLYVVIFEIDSTIGRISWTPIDAVEQKTFGHRLVQLVHRQIVLECWRIEVRMVEFSNHSSMQLVREMDGDVAVDERANAMRGRQHQIFGDRDATANARRRFGLIGDAHLCGCCSRLLQRNVYAIFWNIRSDCVHMSYSNYLRYLVGQSWRLDDHK